MSTAPSAPPPPSFVARAGTLVGSYRLERRLGAGGMGEVWLGRHVVSSGVAAVKLLHPRLASRAGAEALFARERSALLRMSHPHVVPVFEVGASHIAMAYIEGASLARRLRAGIAPELAFRVARQIASALAGAHARGVLHLDVKPSNILMDAAGNAYLADFGASHLFDEESQEPPVAGTPGYLAPERAYGERAGPAADQFALGRTLVAALLGTEKLPVWGAEAAALPASIPDDARKVIARACAVDPRERFPSLAALEGALAACDVEGLAAHVPPLPAVRDEAPYAWAGRPFSTDSMAPEIARAEYRLADLGIPLDGFREATGLETTAIALYGHTRSLGAPGPGWLARAEALVVLVHGYAMTRECWTDMAVALVRDNPDALVVAFDHSGFGDSRYLEDPPAWENIGYAAVSRAILALTELLGVADVPSVILGHSLGATGMVLLPDEAFGAHRARILLTPMFRDLVRGDRGPLLGDLPFRALGVLFRAAPIYRAYFEAYAKLAAPGRGITEARRRAMIEEALRVPVKTHMRLAASVQRVGAVRRQGLRRTYFALGATDTEATPELCAKACEVLGVRPERFRWLASGGHFPHVETIVHPEWTLRNRHELVLLVDEALDELRPAKSSSTEYADTEIMTPDLGITSTRDPAPR